MLELATFAGGRVTKRYSLMTIFLSEIPRRHTIFLFINFPEGLFPSLMTCPEEIKV